MYDLYRHDRNYGARLREYVYRGYRMVALENRWLRVVVAADKGTDIVEFLYKPEDLDFMWRSYTGLRPFHNTIPTIANPNGPFIDYYPGGWQELLPSAGMDCVYKGTALGVHGEVCLLPWDYRIEQDEPERVSVRFSVRTLRTPFYVEKTLTIDDTRPVLTISERVRNEGGETMDLMWGHHPAFGWPFLDQSCRIFLPDCAVMTTDDYTSASSRLEKGQKTRWPVVQARKGANLDLSVLPSPEVRSHDMAYLYDLQDGWYAILNQDRKVGFGLRWDHSTFPSLWFWQVYRGGIGYPWYGATYTVALEPVSSYPPTLTEAIKAHSQLVLEPGAERSTTLLAVALTGDSPVTGIDSDGVVKRG